MPRGSPFTRMCQALARPRHSGRADLHLHTDASDGTYTPQELLGLARKSGFAAIAITDHDTTDGALLANRLRKPGLKMSWWRPKWKLPKMATTSKVIRAFNRTSFEFT